MMETVFIVALIVFSWRLRRASRRPQRIEVHHHHHFHLPGGDGEREAPLLLTEFADDNVIPLRRQQ